LATVKKGGPPGTNPPPANAQSQVASQVGSEILKARNAAGKQAKESPISPYMRPHRVHVGQERKIANERHHRAEMEEEARKHQVLDACALGGAQREEEEENNTRIQGLNFDEQRKKRGRQQREDGEQDDREDGEEAAALGQAAAQKGLAANEGAGKYFQDLPEDRMGDLSLTNPNEMKRVLGPSVRFAQHAMLLAEEQLKQGLPREEVVGFLAELYVGVADRAYAQKALREFGTGTGIIDLYPLEVMKHLLEHVPGYFTKVSKGRFFTSTKGTYKGETGKPIVLTYDPALRIRGFALEGGPRPGYLFEPIDPPGTYHLTFQTPGRFRVLISAIAKNASVAIEELEVEIAQGTADMEEAAAIKRERANEAEQDAEDSSDSDAEKKSKKDDLTIHFPKRI
jgi:hypothetical protein